MNRSQLRRWLPPRPADSHKGRFGHVLLVAGSRGMSGAAVLAGRAALRSGAGLVTIAAPESEQRLIAGQLPEALTLPLPAGAGALSVGSAAELKRSAGERSYDVLGIGPGLGTRPATARAVLDILRGLPLPAVIDADALNILALAPGGGARKLLGGRKAPCILTPHPGEMARLVHSTPAHVQAARPESAKRLSKAWGCVCVLKGRGTVVAAGERIAVNTTGNPGLAKGGTGDVLTGLIAGLWAQHLAAGRRDGGFECAVLGAWLHGTAADVAVRRRTAWALSASDVVDAFGEAFRRLS